MHPGSANSLLSGPHKGSHCSEGDGRLLNAAVPHSTFSINTGLHVFIFLRNHTCAACTGGPWRGANHIVALHFWRPLDWACTQEGGLQLDGCIAVYNREAYAQDKGVERASACE